MTDLEKFKDLFRSVGIGFSERTDEHKYEICTILTCKQGDSKVTGYSSFFSDFVFSGDGSFMELGAWE